MGGGAGADVHLDASPVAAVELEGLEEPLVFLLGPTTGGGVVLGDFSESPFAAAALAGLPATRLASV